MKVIISITNTKLSSDIPSVSLAQYGSCRKDAPCARGCYAKKGNFTYENVKKSHINNLAYFMYDSQSFFNDIITFLKGTKLRPMPYRYFRWHVAGDIVNNEYFEGMIRVANECKKVKFLCFTKQFEIINNYLKSGKKIPNNLHIMFSAWDKTFIVENPYNFPVAYVDFKNKDKNPNFPDLAIPCTGKCYECLACWSLKKNQSVLLPEH